MVSKKTLSQKRQAFQEQKEGIGLFALFERAHLPLFRIYKHSLPTKKAGMMTAPSRQLVPSGMEIEPQGFAESPSGEQQVSFEFPQGEQEGMAESPRGEQESPPLTLRQPSIQQGSILSPQGYQLSPISPTDLWQRNRLNQHIAHREYKGLTREGSEVLKQAVNRVTTQPNIKWLVCPPDDLPFRSLAECETVLGKDAGSCAALRENIVIGPPEYCFADQEQFTPIDDRTKKTIWPLARPLAGRELPKEQRSIGLVKDQQDHMYGFTNPKDVAYLDTLAKMNLKAGQPICDRNPDLQIAGLATGEYNYGSCRAVPRPSSSDDIKSLVDKVTELSKTIDSQLGDLAQNTYNAATLRRAGSIPGLERLTVALDQTVQTSRQRLEALNRLARGGYQPQGRPQ